MTFNLHEILIRFCYRPAVPFRQWHAAFLAIVARIIHHLKDVCACADFPQTCGTTNSHMLKALSIVRSGNSQRS